MSFENLNIIGERINPGFKSSLKLIEEQDVAGIQQLDIRITRKLTYYTNDCQRLFIVL